jgi:hypothetical protein
VTAIALETGKGASIWLAVDHRISDVLAAGEVGGL